MQDIQKHLSKVKCRAVFTTSTLLPKIEQAQKDGADVPGSIFVIGAIQPSLAPACQSWEKALQDHLSDDIPSQWSTPAPSQVAYLCPTSGTSGTQVRINLFIDQTSLRLTRAKQIEIGQDESRECYCQCASEYDA